MPNDDLILENEEGKGINTNSFYSENFSVSILYSMLSKNSVKSLSKYQ